MQYVCEACGDRLETADIIRRSSSACGKVAAPCGPFAPALEDRVETRPERDDTRKAISA